LTSISEFLQLITYYIKTKTDKKNSRDRNPTSHIWVSTTSELSSSSSSIAGGKWGGEEENETPLGSSQISSLAVKLSKYQRYLLDAHPTPSE
jgi:hypothetical protein